MDPVLRALSTVQDDCQAAVELDFNCYDSPFHDKARGFLLAKLFSRFGDLTPDVERRTIQQFQDRNMKAGLATFSDETFVDKYVAFMSNSAPEYYAGLDSTASRQDAVELLNTLRFILRKWAVTAAELPTEFSFGLCGPGSTGILSNDSSDIKKLLWGPQSVGSRSLYKHYVGLLSAQTGHIASALELERSRVRVCRTTIKPQKLIVIKKNSDIGRLIMPQNGIDLYCQKELGSRMTEALLLCFGIDLATAPGINCNAALRGSLDNSICTIDCAAASDSICMALIGFLFQRLAICDQIATCRNPAFTTKSGRVSVMHIVAGMGNDFCFPLQTAIFTAIAKTAALAVRAPMRDARAFGDDIIAPAASAKVLRGLLHALGFVVNDDKSFTSDCYFRESCGGYYYRGADIRPFRLEGTTPYELTTTLNAALEFTAGTGISLPILCDTLIRAGAYTTLVPPNWDPGLGIRCPASVFGYLDKHNLSHVEHGAFGYYCCLPVAREVSTAKYLVAGCALLEQADAVLRLNVDRTRVTTVLYNVSAQADVSPCGYAVGYTRPSRSLDAELIDIDWDEFIPGVGTRRLFDFEVAGQYDGITDLRLSSLFSGLLKYKRTRSLATQEYKTSRAYSLGDLGRAFLTNIA